MAKRHAPQPERNGTGWRCRYVDDAGQRRWTPTLPTPRDAIRAALDQRPATRTRGLDVTLGQAITLGYQDLERHRRSPGTVRWFDGQVGVLRRHWSDDMPLRAWTRQELQRFADLRLRAVSAATVRHHLRCIARLQRLAQRAGWSGTITGRDVAVPTPPPPDPVSMPWRRVRALFRRVRRDRPQDADLMEVIGRTGVRRQEAADLRVGDADLRRNLLTVRKGKRRPRVVPISSMLRPVLARMTADRDPDEILIAGGVETIARTFRRWRVRLKEPRCRAHGLRHSFGHAIVDELDVKIPGAADLLGHAAGSSSVTMRYLSRGERARRDAVELP